MDGMRGAGIAAGLAILWMAGASAAGAQNTPGERAQLCVNMCLFHHGPASNPAYHACVAEICESGGAPAGRARPAPSAPAARWTTHATANGAAHSAAVEAGGRSLNYICQRGGPALIGLAGFGGNPNGVALRIGQRQFRPDFVARNGILYTDAGPALTAALTGGALVEVTAGGKRASFTLAGSGAAIGKAMAGCGIRR